MNVPLRAPASAPRRAWPGLLVQLAIVLVVAAVAAATFVVSYAGVHAIALQSGVPTELARLYPAIFDAVLVIACLALPALRDARWWTRAYTLLVILLIVAVLAAADAVHAMSVALPRRDTAGVVAVLPWVLLLLAFSLWLAVLRHFRAQPSRLAASATVEYAGIVPAEAPAASELPAPAEAAEQGEAAQAAEQGEAAQAAEQGEAAQAAEQGEAAQESSETVQSGSPAPEAPADDAAGPGEAPAEAAAPTRRDLPALPAAGTAPAKEPPSAGSVSLDALLNGPAADREEPAADDAEVPGIAYSTGPRLRRVRSIPAAPVEDE